MSDKVQTVGYKRLTLKLRGSRINTGRKLDIRLIKSGRIKNARWSADTARVGDEVNLFVDTPGYEDGTPVIFNIFEQDNDSKHNFIERIESSVSNEHAQATWIYRYVSDDDDVENSVEERSNSTTPEYYFIVTIEDEEISSDWLEYRNWINILLHDSNGNPAANINYILITSEGEREGTTDSSGRIQEDNLPQGEIRIRLANGKRIRRVQ